MRLNVKSHSTLNGVERIGDYYEQYHNILYSRLQNAILQGQYFRTSRSGIEVQQDGYRYPIRASAT
jgi:hypothetical protein